MIEFDNPIIYRTLWPNSIPKEEFFVFRQLNTNMFLKSILKNENNELIVMVTPEIFESEVIYNIEPDISYLSAVTIVDSINKLHINGEKLNFIVEKYRLDTISSYLIEGRN